MKKTLVNLRFFIDEYLDKYVAGDGYITQIEIRECCRKLDERFNRLLDNVQYEKYLDWREDETGAGNKLRFLMD